MYCPFINLLLICQEMKHYIVLVMELCECDLDHLIEVKPFKEDDIIIFLHQLGKREKKMERRCLCVLCSLPVLTYTVNIWRVIKVDENIVTQKFLMQKFCERN